MRPSQKRGGYELLTSRLDEAVGGKGVIYRKKFTHRVELWSSALRSGDADQVLNGLHDVPADAAYFHSPWRRCRRCDLPEISRPSMNAGRAEFYRGFHG